MKKIVVIGSAGAGKSTLARKIASKIGAKYLELDSVHHQPNWQPINKEEFRQVVDEVTQGSSWVIDGNYYSTVGLDTWRCADAVVWLDRPFAVVFTRLVSRTLRRTISREELWNGNKESFINAFFTKDSVIYFMISKWKSQKRKYTAIFNDPSTLPGVVLIHLRSDRDVRNFMDIVQ
jgi:adenylate kinase family enzyme